MNWSDLVVQRDYRHIRNPPPLRGLPALRKHGMGLEHNKRAEEYISYKVTNVWC